MLVNFERLADVMRHVLDSDVVLGPALSSTGVGGLEKDAFRLIRRQAKELIGIRPYVLSAVPDYALPNVLVLNAMTESIASTSAYLSHMRMGYLNVDESMVLVASRLVEQQLKEFGYDDILTLMFMVNGYDDAQCLSYYGEVLESQFISGELHRPWIHYSLREELEFLVDHGQVERVGSKGEHLTLTSKGRSLYDNRRAFLDRTGFLRRRATLMRWSGFTQLVEYDELMNTLSNYPEHRAWIIEHNDIHEGSRTLELGCGTGELTLTAGLYRKVGTSGEVIATDPSLGMLSRAREKQQQMGIQNVKFIQAAAERLPFKESSFDAVVGCAFLHFTDVTKVLEEVHRVAKPGAIFTTYYSMHFPESSEFFLEWFEPVFRLKPPGAKNDMLLDEQTVPELINSMDYEDIQILPYPVTTKFHRPEMIVRFLMLAVNVFEDAMEQLPWKAQQDMIDHLITRGHEIVEKYGAEQMVQLHPGQYLRARIVK